jgi:capsular exopolysaccharide synthesis family protein
MERTLRKLYPDSAPATPSVTALQVEVLQRSIVVQAVPNTNFIEIRARASSAEAAEQRANAVVEAYIDYIKDDRTRAIQEALNEVKSQVQTPVHPGDRGAQALDLLPGVGEELANIAQSVEQSAAKLETLRTQEQDTNSTQSLLNLEVPEVQRTAQDLDAIAQDLGGIRQGLDLVQQRSFSSTQSPLSVETSSLERTSQDLGRIAEELRDIGGDVLGRDPGKIYSDIAVQADNVRVTLDEVPIALDKVRSNTIKTAGDLASIKDYIKSVSNDLKKVTTQVQAASIGSGLTDQERIRLEGQVTAYTLGLSVARGDLEQIRGAGVLEALDYGHIVTAEGLIGTSIRQLNTLATQLSNSSNTNRLNDGVSQVLGWVEEAQKTLEAVTQILRELEGSVAPDQQTAALSFQIGGEVDNALLLMDTASVRLRGLQPIATDPLIAAQLSAIGSKLGATQTGLAGSSARLNTAYRGSTVNLADGVGVVQGRIQKSAEGLWATMDNIEVAMHLPSTLLENEAAHQAYSDSESIARSLEIASRQLQGLLASNTDPLIDGELSTLGDQLITAQTDVQAMSKRLSTIVEDPRNSTPSELATNQLRLETAARILRTASTVHVDLAQSPDNIDQDIIIKTKEQIEIANAVINLVAGEITRFQAMETDSLRYGQLIVLEQRLREAGTQTADITTQLQQLQGGRGPQYLQLRQLEQQLGLALLQPQDTGITLVDSAVLPQATGRSSIFSRLRIPLAAVAGLMLGSVGVLVRAQLDRTVRSIGQIRDQLGLTNLGVVPKGKISKGQLPKLNTAGLSSFSEALQLVGTSLSGPIDHGTRAFLVTSAGAREGKTTLSVNLAQVLLQYGRRVLLIDGNLRRPEVARVLGLADNPGLAEALASQRNPMDYVVDANGIAVLPGGTVPSNPVELLSSPAMSLFLQQAQQRYDVVVIDGPPAVGFAETKALAKGAGGAILVVKGGSTSIDAVRETRDEIAVAGIPLVGTVLNFAPSDECTHLHHDKYGAGR